MPRFQNLRKGAVPVMSGLITGSSKSPSTSRPGQIEGEVSPSSILRTCRSWGGIEVVLGAADIRRPTDWRISGDRHAVIVHLGGTMDRLETELDGHGGSSGPAVPGEIWSVPSGSVYHSQARGKTIRYAAIYFPPASDESSRPLEIRSVAAERDHLIFKSMQRFSLVLNGLADSDEILAQSLALSAVDHLRRSLTKTSCRNLRPIPPLNAMQSRQIREYVLDTLNQKILLEDLASLVELTPHRFLVAFRKTFGTTPAQFVIDQRVRSAQRLLLHGSHDISTIAINTGFFSHSHLNSAFQRRVGMTPSEFRKEFKLA